MDIIRTLVPSYGEGMRLPEAEAGHVQVRVLSGSVRPRSSQCHCHATSVTRQGLNDSPGTGSADVEVEQAKASTYSIGNPNGDDGIQIPHLGAVAEHLQMDPEANNGEDCQSDVKELESLVESVSQGTPCLETKQAEGASRLRTPLLATATFDLGDDGEFAYDETPEKRSVGKRPLDTWQPATPGPVGDGVNDSLKSYNPAKPSMNQVIRVKRNAQQGYQRIVPPSQKEQGHLKITVSITLASGGFGQGSLTMLTTDNTPARFRIKPATSA